MAGALARLKSLLGFEGSARGPFNGMGELGNFYGIEPLGDGWQRNLEIGTHGARTVPGVYACVMAISRAISQCYPRHIRVADGIREDVKTSAAYRVLRAPNHYQNSPDFLLNLVATALFDGEAFAVATRNDRSEINSLHLLPRGCCSPRVDPDTRDIFYSVGESPLAPGGADFVVPQRDILHLLDQSLRAEGVQIFIGQESGYGILDDCSLVTAPYMLDNETVGVLGVIGPTRMAYERVIPIVDVTARLLSNALSAA